MRGKWPPVAAAAISARPSDSDSAVADAYACVAASGGANSYAASAAHPVVVLMLLPPLH